MDTGVKTRTRRDKPDRSAQFGKFPEAYYRYARTWCHYTRWTIEEAANLLTGCLPHRPMLLPGKEHARLDQEVLEIENRIRAVLGNGLEVIQSRKYFGKTFVSSIELLNWARQQGIVIPGKLVQAADETQSLREKSGYSTPCLEAAEWVIRNWWVLADLREPPTSGEIIQALLQQFPELSGQECEMIEKITRHPVARPDELD